MLELFTPYLISDVNDLVLGVERQSCGMKELGILAHAITVAFSSSGQRRYVSCTVTKADRTDSIAYSEVWMVSRQACPFSSSATQNLFKNYNYFGA